MTKEEAMQAYERKKLIDKINTALIRMEAKGFKGLSGYNRLLAKRDHIVGGGNYIIRDVTQEVMKETCRVIGQGICNTVKYSNNHDIYRKGRTVKNAD